MRILLQDKQTKLFFSRGGWTSDSCRAVDFQFSATSPECMAGLESVDTELVIESDAARKFKEPVSTNPF